MVEQRPARLVGVAPDGRRARRTRTEAELILAVARVLRSGGVQALGLNALALPSSVGAHVTAILIDAKGSGIITVTGAAALVTRRSRRTRAC